MDDSAVRCIHNILTAVIVILFCLICSLINKCCAGAKFFEDGAGGDACGVPCNCKEVEYVGQVTPSNNFIIETGEQLLKVPLYTFLANSSLNQTQSSNTCSELRTIHAPTTSQTKLSDLTDESVEMMSCNFINTPVTKYSPCCAPKVSPTCQSGTSDSSNESETDESSPCNQCPGQFQETMLRCESSPTRSSCQSQKKSIDSLSQAKCPQGSISSPISPIDFCCLETPPPPYKERCIGTPTHSSLNGSKQSSNIYELIEENMKAVSKITSKIKQITCSSAICKSKLDQGNAPDCLRRKKSSLRNSVDQSEKATCTDFDDSSSKNICSTAVKSKKPKCISTSTQDSLNLLSNLLVTDRSCETSNKVTCDRSTDVSQKSDISQHRKTCTVFPDNNICKPPSDYLTSDKCKCIITADSNICPSTCLTREEVKARLSANSYSGQLDDTIVAYNEEKGEYEVFDRNEIASVNKNKCTNPLCKRRSSKSFHGSEEQNICTHCSNCMSSCKCRPIKRMPCNISVVCKYDTNDSLADFKNKRPQSAGQPYSYQLCNRKQRGSASKICSSENLKDEEIKRLYKKYGSPCKTDNESASKNSCQQSKTDTKIVSFKSNNEDLKCGKLKLDTCGENPLKKILPAKSNEKPIDCSTSKPPINSCPARAKSKKCFRCLHSKIPKPVITSKENIRKRKSCTKPCNKNHKEDDKDKEYKQLLSEILEILEYNKLDKESDTCNYVQLQKSKCSGVTKKKSLTCAPSQEHNSILDEVEEFTVLYKDSEFNRNTLNLPSDSSYDESEESSGTLDCIGFQNWQNSSERKKWIRNSCCNQIPSFYSNLSKNSLLNKGGKVELDANYAAKERYSVTSTSSCNTEKVKSSVSCGKKKQVLSGSEKCNTIEISKRKKCPYGKSKRKNIVTINIKKKTNQPDNQPSNQSFKTEVSYRSEKSDKSSKRKSSKGSCKQNAICKMALPGSEASTSYAECASSNAQKSKTPCKKPNCSKKKTGISPCPYDKLSSKSHVQHIPSKDLNKTCRTVKRAHEYSRDEIPKKKLLCDLNDKEASCKNQISNCSSRQDSGNKSKTSVRFESKSDILNNVCSSTQKRCSKKRLNESIEDMPPIKKIKINFKETNDSSHGGDEYNIRLKNGSLDESSKTKTVRVSPGITITTKCNSSVEQLSQQTNTCPGRKPLLRIRIKKNGCNSRTQSTKTVCVNTKDSSKTDLCIQGAKEYLETLRQQNYTPAPQTSTRRSRISDIVDKYHFNLNEPFTSCRQSTRQIASQPCTGNESSTQGTHHGRSAMFNRKHYCYPIPPHYDTYLRIYEDVHPPNDSTKRNFYISESRCSCCLADKPGVPSTSAAEPLCLPPVCPDSTICHQMQFSR